MVSEKELERNNIISWEKIQPRYTSPDLLLGNGFSLQFSNNFSYNSLFEIFLEKCNQTHKNLFRQFETSNFELIQKYLKYALKVNTILGLSTTEIITAIEQLKNGLIQTIEQVHPRNDEIDFNQLENIALQLQSFGNIYTTNYDLYLYHIIMKSKDISRIKKGKYIAYQDYFWGNQAPNGFKQFMTYQNYNYKDVFYLHGSLFLFRKNSLDIKLITNNFSELISEISNEIRDDNFPTFISEGSGKDKLVNIRNNTYLTFCLDKLRSSNNPIIIFGNTLGDFDNHILKAIKQRPKDIIYCIYCGDDRPINNINKEKLDFLTKFNDYTNQIEFVNSSTLFKL